MRAQEAGLIRIRQTQFNADDAKKRSQGGPSTQATIPALVLWAVCPRTWNPTIK